MNTLQQLAEKLRSNQAKCEQKAKAVQHEPYLRGLMNGYAAAYEIAANLVDAAIMEQRIADWDNLIAEMCSTDKEVQA